MTQQVLGPKGSPRRRWTMLVPLTLAIVFGLFYIAGAQAVHDDGFFELGPTPTAPEANITNILGNGTDAGPDWADIFDADGDVVSLFGGHAAAFIPDPSSAGSASDPTTFSGFGTSNKNNDAVSTADCANRTPPLTGSACTPWGWDSGNVPAKDDLTNVYAYEVINPANNHLILYGGIERETPNGDSHVDLEFFQDQVSLVDPGDEFAGIRTVNDIIVSMDYLQGGGLGSVTIRRWDGNQYVQVGVAGGEGCFPKPGGAADSICAFNNGDDIDGGPWPNYDSHAALITTLEANAFTEMGVDLTELIGASPCLSTFMGKTRSSASFTAELKDFAGPHNFDTCQPSTTLSVTPTTSSIHSGGSVTLTFSETNDGNEVLLNPGITATVTPSGTCTPTSVDVSPADGKNDGDTDLDGKLDPGEIWTFACTLTNVTANKTISAYGFGTGELSGKLVTGVDPCTNNATTFCDADERASATITVVNPGTDLVKKASVTVTYRYEESNDGNVALDNPSVSDPDCSPITYSSGDTDSDGDLDTNETWVFTCVDAASTMGDNVDVTNAAIGTGTDPLGFAVTFCTNPASPPASTICDQEERDRVRVRVDHLAGGADPTP